MTSILMSLLLFFVEHLKLALGSWQSLFLPRPSIDPAKKSLGSAAEWRLSVSSLARA